jgi:N6-L-threonylcarbamoyladenine synthase
VLYFRFMSNYILGIESSCDDTSASVVNGNVLLSNVIANQDIHKNFGGVVPEYASRAHQINIVPVIERALQLAKIQKNQLSAVAFTCGPGLLGSLLVGTSFAKSMALALDIPLIEVDHLQAHILSHFIVEKDENKQLPEFPFLCMIVSGGHTMIVSVKDHSSFEIIGNTIDDAAGEAFDKAAKILGLPYPGGQMIDLNAKSGNPLKFSFPEPKAGALDFSFSGLKTSFLYFIRDNIRINPGFVEENLQDLCASIQHSIVRILIKKLSLAAKQTGIRQIAISGGVSANSYLRQALTDEISNQNWTVFIPKIVFSTDNAAMVAVAGYYKFMQKEFASQNITPYTRNQL